MEQGRYTAPHPICTAHYLNNLCEDDAQVGLNDKLTCHYIYVNVYLHCCHHLKPPTDYILNLICKE